MSFSKKLLLICLLLLLIWGTEFCFMQLNGFTEWYAAKVYPAIQNSKGFITNIIPFSIGDIIYILAGGSLLLTVIRWVYYIIRFGIHKERLGHSILNMINICLGAYLFFLISWGGNYHKIPLARSWGLTLRKTSFNSAAYHRELKEMNLFLLSHLKTYAPQQKHLNGSETNTLAISYFRAYTQSRVKDYGLYIKPSLFTFIIRRMGVDGYYNPFTGEGQANISQPSFMLPFLICHEMAHQCGIAAEGDANLLAYTLCSSVNDPHFRYSAYLNLWMYANRKLYYADSAEAKKISAQLPDLTSRQLDTMKQLYLKYQGAISRYTTDVYDEYLRMHRQDGINTYGNVVREAWALEQQRNKRPQLRTIYIP